MKVIIHGKEDWHVKQDQIGFWETYIQDDELPDTGAPSFRFANFDDLIRAVGAYEQAYERGYEAGRKHEPF